MNIQKLTWLLERTLYYTLLLLTGSAVIYSFTIDKTAAGMVSLIFMMGVIHKGFAQVTLPPKSVAIQDGKVVFYTEVKTTLNRFDVITQGQKIVTLPVYGVFDRPYRLEVFFPGGAGVTSCMLTLKLAYGTDLTVLQCAYDSYVEHESRYSEAVRNRLAEVAADISFVRVPEQHEGNYGEYLKPIVTALNRGIASLGIEVREADCTFASSGVLTRVQLS